MCNSLAVLSHDRCSWTIALVRPLWQKQRMEESETVLSRHLLLSRRDFLDFLASSPPTQSVLGCRGIHGPDSVLSKWPNALCVPRGVRLAPIRMEECEATESVLLW